MKGAVLLSVAAVINGEECQTEPTSMIQVARMRASVGSQRHLHIYHNKQTDEKCLPVVMGDKAPVAGKFTAEGSSNPVQVTVGQIASSAGTFCVDSTSFSLLQRSMSSLGLNMDAVEASLARKESQGNVDNSVQSKGGSPEPQPEPEGALPAPAGYSMVAARCKPDGKGIGEEQVGKTLAECKALCDGNSQCAAFEFEPETGECELSSGVDKEVSLADEDGPCSAESCCYSRPLPAPTGYSAVAARCKPDGKGIGEEQVDKTLEQCKALCDANPQCAAFEHEPATGECELSSGVDKEVSLADEDGPCTGDSCCYSRPLPAPTGYSVVAARCKPDGKGIGEEQVDKTLEQCKALCDANPQCAAFEHEPATGECELSSGVDKEVSLADEDGPCTGDSCCYSRPLPAPTGYSMVAARCKPDSTSLGEEQVDKTLEECKALCDANSLCAAFEFEPASGECELSSGVDKEVALADEDGPCSGDSCCYSRPLPAPTGYSMLAARCKPDGNALGEEQVGRTLDGCKASCDANPQCAAFEYEPASGECELSSGVDKEVALADEDGPCSGESCCYGRPLPAPTGYVMMAARCKPDGNALGAEQVGKTLAQCQALCNGNSDCRAFEFEPGTGECELVTSVDRKLSLQDEDGACNGESCCYGRPAPAPAGYKTVAARCKPDGNGLGEEQIVQTLGACKELCAETDGCTAFEYEYGSGECELVSAVDETASLADEDGPCNGDSCCYAQE